MSIWLLILQNIIPEAIAALLTLTVAIEPGEFFFICWLFLAYSVLLRLIWNSSIVIHGLGHTLAIAIVDQKISVLTITNILEHRSIGAVSKSLLPFNTLFIPLCNNRPVLWIAAGKTSSWRIRAKALGGILFNLLAMVLVLNFASYLFPDKNTNAIILFFDRAFVTANLLIAVCSFSDITALVTGIADDFYCGNFGFIAKRNSDDGNLLLPPRMVKIARQMGKETEIRGEQAGGGLVVARGREDRVVFVGKKIVNQKRANLTKSLEAAFAPIRKKAFTQGIKPLKSSVMGVWHYRYATSGSSPTELETHWHEWMSARSEKVWAFSQGEWVCQQKNVNHRITHNGDFDAWRLFGKEIDERPRVGARRKGTREFDNTTLGLWLQRVLHTPNATKGDSPKIAGLMDLLITKGMWYASVRLAYQLAIASGIEAAFGGEQPAPDAPNTAPSVEYLTNWAEIFESIFTSYRLLLPEPNTISYQKYLSRLEEDLIQATKNYCSWREEWSESKRIAFVKTAIDAFLHNDLYRATQIFMSKAKGSFGLVTVSTLEEELVLSAKGQPISIGFNWQQGYMVYASEPAAVDRVLLGTSGSTRLDLDPQLGEIAKVSADKITIYAMNLARELIPPELEDRWILLENHPYLPYIKFSQSDNQDLVAADIQSIPQVLDEIKTVWQNPASLNRKSADYLVYLLTEKVQRFEQKRQKMFQAGLTSQVRRMPTVDLFITGEENSLWLGEKFAQDLKTIFPFLNVVTISANQALQQIDRDFSEFYLGKNSLVLGITQSGQTFSTVRVINILDNLCSQGIIGEVFILTGELSSFINSDRGNGGLTAVFQPSSLETLPRHRIFVNGSGRRTAEPATVSVAAANQTLTELLFYLVKQLSKKFPNSHPFGMTLTQKSLTVLEMMKEDFLDKTVVQITGTTANGKAIKSSIKQKLIKTGRHWALHVTETPLVWAIHALYVLVTVGWAIPFGYTIPLVKTILGSIFALANLPQNLWELIAPLVTGADIAIYIFGPWLWTLLLRYFQGRQLLARMGKRTLVIGDVSWVNQLLQSYVSKLFSLSYGIASLEVHGSNPQNHLLHAFGHRVVRGTLLFLGVPDGRRSPKIQQEENAVIMTGKQANGVRNIKVGPEIIVMGHNPAIAQKGFSDAIILDDNDDSIYFRNQNVAKQKDQIEELRESCFGTFERLLASYVFFWALAKKVAGFPFLRYQYWKSQSRTKIMTTASPVAGLDESKLANNNNKLNQLAKLKNNAEKN